MKNVTDYILKTTGLNPDYQPVQNRLLEKLPLFIRKGFRFYKGNLAGRDLLFLIPEAEEMPPPKQLQVQVKTIEELFGVNTVLVFGHIEPYMRNQLTQMKMAFVVADEQLYIPWMFIALDERKRLHLTHVETFYPATQALLFYHLLKKPLNGLNLKEIAENLGYTPMTVTRAIRELEAAEVCTTRGGRQKIVEFTGNKKAIWDTAEPFMKHPVQKEMQNVYAGKPETGRWTLAGINALAAYTNLHAGYDKTWAVKKENINKQEEISLAAEPGEATVQLWLYDPAMLAKGDVADPLSLYLTLKDHPDERVQIALDEMMDKIKDKWIAEETVENLKRL